MKDALQMAHAGEQALRNLLPASFDWPLFSLALVLLSAPLLYHARELRLGRLMTACWLATVHKSGPADHHARERTAQLD